MRLLSLTWHGWTERRRPTEVDIFGTTNTQIPFLIIKKCKRERSFLCCCCFSLPHKGSLVKYTQPWNPTTVKIILPVIRLLTELWLINHSWYDLLPLFMGESQVIVEPTASLARTCPSVPVIFISSQCLPPSCSSRGSLPFGHSACPLSLDQSHSGSAERSIIQEEKQPVGQERLQQLMSAVHLLGKLLVIVIAVRVAVTCNVLHFCCWGTGHTPTRKLYAIGTASIQRTSINKSLSLTFRKFSYHITVTDQTNIIDNCHISQTLL